MSSHNTPASPRSPEDDYHTRLHFLSSLPPASLLRELLAVIHRDGGQYADEVGLARATLVAENLWAKRNDEKEKLLRELQMFVAEHS